MKTRDVAKIKTSVRQYLGLDGNHKVAIISSLFRLLFRVFQSLIPLSILGMRANLKLQHAVRSVSRELKFAPNMVGSWTVKRGNAKKKTK